MAGRVDDISKLAKDALYISVGLGVIAFQKAQVQRRELATQVESVTKQLRERALRRPGNGRAT